MKKKSSKSLVEITDFGLFKHFSSINVLETFVGTPVYMESEVISLVNTKVANKGLLQGVRMRKRMKGEINEGRCPMVSKQDNFDSSGSCVGA